MTKSLWLIKVWNGTIVIGEYFAGWTKAEAEDILAQNLKIREGQTGLVFPMSLAEIEVTDDPEFIQMKEGHPDKVEDILAACLNVSRGLQGEAYGIELREFQAMNMEYLVALKKLEIALQEVIGWKRFR